MQSQNAAIISPPSTTTPRESASLIHVTHDSFGAVAAEYFFYPDMRVLYVQWHGHVTSDELVRAAEVGLRINQQVQPRVLVHDTRGTSGDWGEAISWVEYEWIPGIKTHCQHLRGIGFVLDADTPTTYSNALLLEKLDQQFEFETFYSSQEAWQWISRRTMSPQA